MPDQSTTVRICTYCGKTLLPRHQRFCSRPCYRGYYAQESDRLRWTSVNKTTSCWLWAGKMRGKGYGTTTVQGYPEYVHRAAWVQATGQPIPRGMHVCHTCDIRHCVRNDELGEYTVDGIAYVRWGHLFLAPREINCRDAVLKGRTPTGERGGMVKLTKAIVLSIRDDFASKRMNQKQLAALHKVSTSNISAIIQRETWTLI